MNIGDRVRFTNLAREAFGDPLTRLGTVTQTAPDGAIEVLSDHEKTPHWWPADWWQVLGDCQREPIA
jgi:hypothetical protein